MLTVVGGGYTRPKGMLEPMNIGDGGSPRILITGANRGLGLEFVHQLLPRGARLMVACRDPDNAQALHELASRHAGQLEIVTLDLADPVAIQALADTLIARDEPLDWLINNAGVLVSGESLGTVTAQSLRYSLAVNTIAPFLLSQALAPLLRRGRAPRIANVSSILGSVAHCEAFRTPSYSISKSALNMATALLARALSPDGVRVVALHPGWVRTQMGGDQAELDPATSARGLLAVIEGLTAEHDGTLIDYQGQPLPW